MALETKGAKGHQTPAQRTWLAALRAAGVEAYCVWPRDEREIRELLLTEPER